MAITIDGDNGISGVNGTATTPALQGTDSNTGIVFGTDEVQVATGGSTRTTVDSSGRLLVSLSSSSAEPIAAFQGRGTDSADSGIVAISRSGTNPSGSIGELRFATGSDLNKYYAMVICSSDGSTSSTSLPGVLRFATTASSATSPTERMRLDSSGRLLIGTSSAREHLNDGSDSAQVFIQGTTQNTSTLAVIRSSDNDGPSHIVLGKARGTGSGSTTVVQDGDTIGHINFEGADGSHLIRAAQISCVVDGGPGANDMPGRLTFKTTANGSNSLTERVRITSSGFSLFGKTTSSISTAGVSINANDVGGASTGTIVSTVSGEASLYCNRLSNDGVLIDFRQGNTQEGTINVSGSTVSYNGGHLSRWSQLAAGLERTEILRGSVLSNLDEMCEWAYEAQDAVLYTEEDELPEGVSVGDVKTPAIAAGTEDNEQLNRMKVSDVEGDANVAGVFQGWDDDDDTYDNDFYCAMTGDFVIRIAQGTTVARGDLLMSAGDGTAKPQDDDIVRSKTIAKVTSITVSTTYSDGSYCVPCVLMAC